MILAAELVLLYTHNLSVPVVGWLNLVVVGFWLWRRCWRWLGIWLGGQIVMLLAYVPWLLSQAPSGTSINSPPRFGTVLAWDIWQGYFAPLPMLIGAKNALVIGSAALGVLAAVSLAVLWTWNWQRPAQLVVSQFLLIPALATAELLAANIDFHPRYYIAAVPASLLVITFGVVNLPGRRDLHQLVLPLVTALAFGVSAASLTALLNEPKYGHDDFHAVADYYATLPDDAIILIPYGWEPAIEEYYAEKSAIRAEILGIDLHSSPDTVIETINAALAQRNGPVRVELLTWFQLPADLRGLYPCLLESAGQRAREPGFVVQGISTTGYWLGQPVALADVLDAPVDYNLLMLNHAAVTGRQAVCLRTTWELRQPSRYNWRVAGRLLTIDPPRWIIARSDTDIRDDEQLPTSTWETGDQGESFSLLHFPAGTPPGDYTVQISVYSHFRPDGLDQLVNGIPSGRTTALATVQPAGTLEIPIRGDGFTPVQVAPQVELTGYDAGRNMALTPGQEVRITLHWHVLDDCCRETPWTEATVSLRGDTWEVTRPVEAYGTYSLDWHTFVVPPEASGSAALTVQARNGDPITLLTYTIEPSEHLFAPPAFDVPVQTEFVDLAVLEGFSVGQRVVSANEKLDLTLVWRVLDTPDRSYRVFTHLLDTNGQVIAQHDDFPVHGTRLTTGWVQDEYLIDPYALEFLPERRDYQGPAHLEVGFYDPDSGERVRIAGGADHLVLPIEITVQ